MWCPLFQGRIIQAEMPDFIEPVALQWALGRLRSLPWQALIVADTIPGADTSGGVLAEVQLAHGMRLPIRRLSRILGGPPDRG